jgi:hypothetical protein
LGAMQRQEHIVHGTGLPLATTRTVPSADVSSSRTGAESAQHYRQPTHLFRRRS